MTKHPHNANTGTNWPRSLAISERNQTWVVSGCFYLPLEAALSGTGNSCECTTQKVHVLTVSTSLSFTKAQMSVWTVQTVPFTTLNCPYKSICDGHTGASGTCGEYKCKGGGVGGPVALSNWGCDVHNPSPLLGSTSNMVMPGRISYCKPRLCFQ